MTDREERADRVEVYSLSGDPMLSE